MALVIDINSEVSVSPLGRSYPLMIP
jgi:hypothetical protein